VPGLLRSEFFSSLLGKEPELPAGVRGGPEEGWHHLRGGEVVVGRPGREVGQVELRG